MRSYAALFIRTGITMACSDSDGKLNGFGGKIIRREGYAFVETLDAPGSELYAVHLTGIHYEMGRQYGALLGDKIITTYELTKAMLGKNGLPEAMVRVLANAAWSHYSKYIPECYRRELDGVVEGANRAGVPLEHDMLKILAAVPEFTGYWHMEEMVGKLIAEGLGNKDAEDEETGLNAVWDGKERDIGPLPTHCSSFMAWGERTEGGNLFGCRNLDWAHDTGMSAVKCVTVFHPVKENGEPGVASAVFGHIGVLGSLAGINAEGVALGEIGSYSGKETFEGRPWHYVFREVLDDAHNLDEATEIFNRGNYVQGYCFTAGWGDPRRKDRPDHAPKGAAIEVNAEEIAILYDNDPQEQEAVCVDTGGNSLLFDGEPVKYGMPLENAVFRADTAFSKSVRKSQYADKGPAGPKNNGNAKEGRTWRELYMPISLMLKAKEAGEAFDLPGKEAWHFTASAPHALSIDEALDICKMAGDNNGNVMSIFYNATDLKAAVAFEMGTGETWTPASKAGYVELDLAGAFDY